MSTKDRILEAAIDLFSEKGYKEVSIREITRVVGIKESSLYNHFASKQQILDEIFNYLLRQYEARTVPEEEDAAMVAGLTPREFIDMSVKSFETYLGNPVFVKIWRILSIERFTNPRARDLFNRHIVDEPIRYQAGVFGALMERGLMPRQDPMLFAREFYSYILYIYIRYIETDKDVTLAGNAEFHRMIREHMEFLKPAFSPQ